MITKSRRVGNSWLVIVVSRSCANSPTGRVVPLFVEGHLSTEDTFPREITRSAKRREPNGSTQLVAYQDALPSTVAVPMAVLMTVGAY